MIYASGNADNDHRRVPGACSQQAGRRFRAYSDLPQVSGAAVFLLNFVVAITRVAECLHCSQECYARRCGGLARALQIQFWYGFHRLHARQRAEQRERRGGRSAPLSEALANKREGLVANASAPRRKNERRPLFGLEVSVRCEIRPMSSAFDEVCGKLSLTNDGAEEAGVSREAHLGS